MIHRILLFGTLVPMLFSCTHQGAIRTIEDPGKIEAVLIEDALTGKRMFVDPADAAVKEAATPNKDEQITTATPLRVYYSKRDGVSVYSRPAKDSKVLRSLRVGEVIVGSGKGVWIKLRNSSYVKLSDVSEKLISSQKSVPRWSSNHVRPAKKVQLKSSFSSPSRLKGNWSEYPAGTIF